MNRMMKFAMAAVIALASSSAWAQAAITGKQLLLPANTNKWDPMVPATAEANSMTGTFHAGGVAACDGCHVMHNANGGKARSTLVAPWTNAVPAFLLQGSDQSSTCLNCHGDATTPGGNTKPYVIANLGADTSTMNYSPAGDFGWLKLSTATGVSHERMGHNVVALDFGLAGDTSMTVAAGGTYVPGTGVNGFACSTCHDPHGRYRMQYVNGTTWQWAGPVVSAQVNAITQPIYSSGSYGQLPKAVGAGAAAVGAYRLLAGVGYSPASSLGSISFVSNPPVAMAPPAYNHSETGKNEVRVAYGTGMSEWCANCHTNIHMDNYTSGAMGASGLKHPAGSAAFLKPGQVTVYQTYVSSGIFTASGTNSYTSLVPFENAGKVVVTNGSGSMADLADLSTAATTAGATDPRGIFQPSTTSNVMCLSCHRAHASGFSSMVRWNADDTFITNSDAANFVNTQGRTTNQELVAGYYGRIPTDFGIYQRSMCNKCHGKD
jgi:hypothetical protein